MSYDVTPVIERIRERHLARKAVREFGAEVLFNQDGASHVVSFKNEYDGGPGSGNWGHEGRKGEVGGSKKGGGAHNRQTASGGGFTSFSKKKKQLASPHKVKKHELDDLPVDAKVVLDHSPFSYFDGKMSFSVIGNKEFLCNETGEVLKDTALMSILDKSEKNARVLIPNNANPNYTKRTFKFSPSRMKNAKLFTENADADSALRPLCQKVWKTLDSTQKISLSEYTGSNFTPCNGALRGDKSYQTPMTKLAIESMTDAISKSCIKEDMFVFRGVSFNSISKMFGFERGDVDSSNVNELVGMAGTDDGFMSCGSTQETAFSKDVMLKIYCPKGTEAIYAEPFSQFGGASLGTEPPGSDWDGESKQSSYGEVETIIQRGTNYTCTGCKVNESGKFEVELAITGQQAKKLDW